MKINKGIAVGLAVSVVLVSVVSAQYALQPSGRIFQAGAPLFPAQAFAPHPSNIVNLEAFSGGGSTGSHTVDIVTPLTIYEVPADKYFVLTTWSFDNGGWSCVLAENFAGMETVKLGRRWINTKQWSTTEWQPLTFSPLGLVFRPGSSVVLRRSDTSTTPNIDIAYYAVGYLVDA